MIDVLGEFEKTYVRPREGRTLIVGSKVYKTRADRRRLFSSVVGVDMLSGEGVDRVVNMEEQLPTDFGVFDHVECLSVLEHSKKPWAIAQNIVNVMRPNSTLFLTVPFVWRVHGYPDDYFRFTLHGVQILFPSIRWKRICYASTSLTDEFRVPQTIIDDHIYFARTEIYGFGRLVS